MSPVVRNHVALVVVATSSGPASKNAVRNPGHDTGGGDVVDERPLLPTDPGDLWHNLYDQLCDLFVVQVRRGHDKCADVGIQDSLNLKLIPADVLVLCDKNPLPLAENGKEITSGLPANSSNGLASWPSA